jgi:hypothetical protein
MEKLLRNARAGLIADGCNEILALKGRSLIVNTELLKVNLQILSIKQSNNMSVVLG